LQRETIVSRTLVGVATGELLVCQACLAGWLSVGNRQPIEGASVDLNRATLRSVPGSTSS
jgi:hypothetical protein